MSKVKEYFITLKRVDLDELNNQLNTKIQINEELTCLNTNQVLEYHQNGIIILDEIIPGTLIQNANIACDKLDSLVAHENLSYADFNLEAKEGGWRSQDGRTKCYMGEIRRVKNIIDHSEFFQNVALHPNILRAVYSLLGPKFRLHSKGFLMNKPSLVSSEKDWHQDRAYFPNDRENITTVWIPLQDVDENNGCLHVVKGSHKLGVLPHIGEEAHLNLEQFNSSDSVPCVMKVGSLAMCDKSIVHYSGKNTTSSPRRALLFRYQKIWIPGQAEHRQPPAK